MVHSFRTVYQIKGLGNNLDNYMLKKRLCQINFLDSCSWALADFMLVAFSPMSSFGLRMHDNSGRVNWTGIFTSAATDAQLTLNAGTMLRIGIDRMLGALLLANQAKLAFGPTQATALINDRQADEGLGNGGFDDGSGRTYILTLLA